MKTQITAQILGLKEDLEKEHKKIKTHVNYALTETGVEMTYDLISALRRDWYGQYKPSVYERRTDNPSKGTPLGDMSNFDETYTDPTNQILHFVYNPTGTHENPDWNTRSGDNLIEWIQRMHEYKRPGSDEPYLKIPARPFWNNFIDELINGGIMSKFIKAMSPTYTVLEDKSDKKGLEAIAAESYLPQDFEE